MKKPVMLSKTLVYFLIDSDIDSYNDDDNVFDGVDDDDIHVYDGVEFPNKDAKTFIDNIANLPFKMHVEPAEMPSGVYKNNPRVKNKALLQAQTPVDVFLVHFR
jgi:hypothetical protein